MQASLNPARRYPRPPEPVDETNPQWLARAFQWLFDRLDHLDECMDGVKEQTQDTRATLDSFIVRVTDAEKVSRAEKRALDRLWALARGGIDELPKLVAAGVAIYAILKVVGVDL